MQKIFFTLIFLCATLLLITGSADAKTSSHIIAAVKLSATINKLNQHGEIRWYTLPGQNNMLRFELQKSADGNNFSYVTSVAGGHRNTLKQYFAEDRNLLEGNNFYRLKIIYKDGYETYSAITQIAAAAPLVTILPAVAEERLYIWLPENMHILAASVSDISGKIIFENGEIAASSGVADLDIKKLQPGFYNITLQTSFAQKIHLKFSKK